MFAETKKRGRNVVNVGLVGLKDASSPAGSWVGASARFVYLSSGGQN